MFIEADTHTILAQIGETNVLAISGGRVIHRDTGVTLPVSNGYRVTVDLAAGDTYTVRRIFERAGKTWVKGELSGIYAEQLGEIAFQASSFRSYEFPQHTADALADAMLDEAERDPSDDERLRRELATTSAGVLITPRDLGDGRVEIVPGLVVQSEPLLRNVYDGWAGTGYGTADVSGAIGADGNVYSDADPGL